MWHWWSRPDLSYWDEKNVMLSTLKQGGIIFHCQESTDPLGFTYLKFSLTYIYYYLTHWFLFTKVRKIF